MQILNKYESVSPLLIFRSFIITGPSMYMVHLSKITIKRPKQINKLLSGLLIDFAIAPSVPKSISSVPMATY